MEYKIAELNLDFFHRSLINLVQYAIKGESTSVALRVSVEFCRIQIVDNGIGFPFDILQNVGECKNRKSCFNRNKYDCDYYYSCHRNYRNIVKEIAELLVISTKCINSNVDYEKTLRDGLSSTIRRIPSRPTHGTTSTIHLQQNLMKRSFKMVVLVNSVKHLAKNYPQISFSIRDDDEQEIILQIKKKFKMKSRKKVYRLKPTSLSILPLISNSERKSSQNPGDTNNVSFFRYKLNSKMETLGLPNKTSNKKTPTQIVGQLSRTHDKSNSHNESVPSQWSDWNLESLKVSSQYFEKSVYKIVNANEKRRYRFLPAKLTKLLPLNTNKKLVNRKMTQEFNTCGVFDNLPRRQDFDVRICNKINKMQYSEITLDHDSLKNMEVMNQINSEFIAATVLQNGRKLLILIDQHAMHERIRYENLLRDYKNDKNQLTSVELDHVIKIDDIPLEICELILKNRQLFINFGVELHRGPANAMIIIKTIPRCFLKKKIQNLNNLISIIRELLLEIINKLIDGIGFHNLPITIHNVIASEACHGAIKFGDPLNIDQCNVMVDYWKQTNLPNRCAHGRPVIIPLLSIGNK